MNEEKQRIAIAEFCGLKPEQYFRKIVWVYGGAMHMDPPDYLNDLNAMFAAEQKLNGMQMQEYTHTIIRAIDSDGAVYPEDFLVHASSKTRAEAFLHVIRKWEDS